MTEDARAARLLVAEKEAFRELEATATSTHFARLRARSGQGAESGSQGDAVAGSALHLDLLREFKRLNSHLVAAAAYPVLEGQGELLSSRLRADP
jgi:phosphate:Na+ symporter